MRKILFKNSLIDNIFLAYPTTFQMNLNPTLVAPTLYTEDSISSRSMPPIESISTTLLISEFLP